MIATTLRRAVPGNAAKKLEAVAALRALESERVKIDDFYVCALTAWNNVEQRLSDAEADYKKAISQRDLAGVKQAAAVLPLLRLQMDHVRTEAGNVGNLRRVGVPFAQFVKEHPEARETCLGFVRGTLQQAEENAASVLTSEKALLPDWGDATASPKVQRANSLVNQLTATLARIEGNKLSEELWRSACQFLE
jgi:hypothetical protein